MFFVVFAIQKSLKKGMYLHYYNHMLWAISSMIATKLLFGKLNKSKKTLINKEKLEARNNERREELRQLSQNIILLEETLNAEQNAYETLLRAVQQKQQHQKQLMEALAYGKNKMTDLMERYEIIPIEEFRSICDAYFAVLAEVNEVNDEMHEVENEFLDCYGDWEEKRQLKIDKLLNMQDRVIQVQDELKVETNP